MKTQAEVVIIGAGVIGTSIAWHLAKAGCADVVIVERSHVCAGSSSKGVGGFRQQFDTEISVRFSQLNLPTLLDMAEEIDLHQCGYMYLALSDAGWSSMQERVARQRGWDVPVELLSTDEVAYRYPFLNTSDVRGAAFCAVDGLARPPLAVEVYARRARALGVEIIENADVLGIERDASGERVVAVTTTQGRIAARQVVIAAGAWSGQVGALAGIELPVQPLKRQAFHTGSTAAAPPDAPFTIDSDTGFHFRTDGDGLLTAMSDGEQLGVEELSVDMEFGRTVLTHARHRLPHLSATEPGASRAGFYEMTPDAHPILGAIPGVEGLFCACGFSGHGFMHSATTGLLMTELLTTGATTTLDISSLALTRFTGGTLLGLGKVL